MMLILTYKHMAPTRDMTSAKKGTNRATQHVAATNITRITVRAAALCKPLKVGRSISKAASISVLSTFIRIGYAEMTWKAISSLVAVVESGWVETEQARIKMTILY